MLRTVILFLIASLSVLSSYSQYSHRQYQDVFPTYGDFHRRGWIAAPSFNYTLPNFKTASERLWLEGGSVYDVNYDPAGKLGIGFEFGRFHLIERSRLISYVQLTMGIKMLNGIERYEAVLDDPGAPAPQTIEGQGTFNHTYATMSFAASNIQQFSATSFLQNTLGINGDYRVRGTESYETNGLPITIDSPTRFIFQAHYRVGFGFKVSRSVVVVPEIETPILTFYQYEDLKSTHLVFNSRYRPLIFRLNILLLDKRANRKCPSKKPKRKDSESLFGSTGAQPW